MAVEDLVGGINDPVFGGTPEGKVWDPLGLGADEASLYRRRVVEIKHGRVCMVAFIGMTVGPNDVRCAAIAALPPPQGRTMRAAARPAAYIFMHAHPSSRWARLTLPTPAVALAAAGPIAPAARAVARPAL